MPKNWYRRRKSYFPLSLKLEKTGKNVIVVYVNGRPISEPWISENTNAIIEAWEPGSFGGLAVGEIIPAEGDIFDYAAKYQVGAAQEIFPAMINQDIEKKIRKMALLAHKSLKLGSYSRVDFRMDSAGDLWVLEVNTLPGLSSGSLLPKSAEANGVGFVQLCERICRGAIVSKE